MNQNARKRELDGLRLMLTEAPEKENC